MANVLSKGASRHGCERNLGSNGEAWNGSEGRHKRLPDRFVGSEPAGVSRACQAALPTLQLVAVYGPQRQANPRPFHEAVPLHGRLLAAPLDAHRSAKRAGGFGCGFAERQGVVSETGDHMQEIGGASQALGQHL